VRSMKEALELIAEISAATAAILWFLSARVRLSRRDAAKRGLASGVDDPKALLRLVYQQSQRNARAAIAAGLPPYLPSPMALCGSRSRLYRRASTLRR
jgi:hypothetical protein